MEAGQFLSAAEAVRRVLVLENPICPPDDAFARFGSMLLPTMGAFLRLLPAQFRGEPYRSTDNVVFVAVEGAGRLASFRRINS